MPKYRKIEGNKAKLYDGYYYVGDNIKGVPHGNGIAYYFRDNDYTKIETTFNNGKQIGQFTWTNYLPNNEKYIAKGYAEDFSYNGKIVTDYYSDDFCIMKEENYDHDILNGETKVETEYYVETKMYINGNLEGEVIRIYKDYENVSISKVIVDYENNVIVKGKIYFRDDTLYIGMVNKDYEPTGFGRLYNNPNDRKTYIEGNFNSDNKINISGSCKFVTDWGVQIFTVEDEKINGIVKIETTFGKGQYLMFQNERSGDVKFEFDNGNECKIKLEKNSLLNNNSNDKQKFEYIYENGERHVIYSSDLFSGEGICYLTDGSECNVIYKQGVVTKV